MFAGKPLASLSSGLLARKGQARPAMRPQLATGFIGPVVHDDLGWNDMGADAATAPALPPVLVAREALKGEVEQASPAPVADSTPEPVRPLSDAVPEPEPTAPVPPELVAAIGRETARAKAAFTLRLPPDRHLRLRIASAVRHRSAQVIVTEALDAFLAALPEVEELARQCAAPVEHRP